MRLSKSVLITAAALTVGCRSSPREPEDVTPVDVPPTDVAPADIAPRDKARWIAVTIDDAAEAGLIQQQLKATVVRVDGNRLYLVDRPGLQERLATAGYEPAMVDRQEAETRVVRVPRRGDEKALLQSGVHLINREDRYWIVRGTLRQLALLQRLGFQIAPLGPDEPRPREVRISVRSRDDVARVAATHVDIYSVRQEKDGIVIYAGAFDSQIDSLQAAGYRVERRPTIGP
jgi:hypothetical protein